MDEASRHFGGLLCYIHDATTAVDNMKNLAALVIKMTEENKQKLGSYDAKHPLALQFDRLIAQFDSKPSFPNRESFFYSLYNDNQDFIAEVKKTGAPYNLDIEELEMALLDEDCFVSWGQHYPRDLRNKYLHHVSTNQKDRGPLTFISSRQKLLLQEMEKIENLIGKPIQTIDSDPNWKPVISSKKLSAEEIQRKMIDLQIEAREVSEQGGYSSITQISTGGAGGCFDALAKVTVFNSSTLEWECISACLLKKGDKILCNDDRIGVVEAVFITPSSTLEKVSVNGLVITTHHPIFLENEKKFMHAKNHPDAITLQDSLIINVLTIMLDFDSVEAGCHSILVNKLWVICAGHNRHDEIAEHCFWGNFKMMILFKKYLTLLNESSESNDSLFIVKPLVMQRFLEEVVY
jgi:hypothetical protein